MITKEMLGKVRRMYLRDKQSLRCVDTCTATQGCNKVIGKKPTTSRVQVAYARRHRKYLLDILRPKDARMLDTSCPSYGPHWGPFRFGLGTSRNVRCLVLFGTKVDLSAHYAELGGLGNITHVLLGDRHHASEHTFRLAADLEISVSASQIEASAVKVHAVGAIVPFRRTQIVPGLEEIPTPGNTRGALSYRRTHGGRRFLFVGDTLVPVGGEWHLLGDQGQPRGDARIDASVGGAGALCDPVQLVRRAPHGMGGVERVGAGWAVRRP